MNKLLFVFWMIGVSNIVEIAFSQVPTTAVPFLTIVPNARSSGMGEAGVALCDDAWASYWNPAGYAFQSGSEGAVNYAHWQPSLNLGDVWIAHTVYKQDMRQIDGTVSGSFTYIHQGEIGRTINNSTVLETFKSYEMALALGYSRKLSDVFALGLNIRLIHSALSPFGSPQGEGQGIATGFSFDIGMLYHPRSLFIPLLSGKRGDRVSFGFNLSNIGPKLTYMNRSLADPLPMNLRLGFAFRFMESKEHSGTVVADFNKLLINYTGNGTDEFYQAIFTSWTGRTFRLFNTGMGVEYWYGSPKLIAVRMGYFYEDPRGGDRTFLTFGSGVRVDSYEFDFSYIAASEKDHPLGGTLRFSLLLSWD